jgi:soluble lytic murein transglycosylase-like protein
MGPPAAIVAALALVGLVSAVPASSQAGADPARGRYAREIREISERHGVSRELVEAVIQVESAFNPRAVSPRGAQGLMQLMPGTAHALGVQNVFDPRENIDGGVRHLRHLIGRFPGDLPRALAAYNAGEGAVESFDGIPPYAETRGYVRKVLLLSASPTPVTAPPPDDAGAGRAAEVGRPALPAVPLIDEGRGAGRESISAMLGRLKREGLAEEIRAGSGDSPSRRPAPQPMRGK